MTQSRDISQFANNLNSAGQLDATDGLFGSAPVANGGSGANTASVARTNFGMPSRTGSGATGTWGINITGNAATAVSATSATNAGTVGTATFATTAGNAGVTSVNSQIGAINLASLAAFNRSFSSSGYQYLPGGLLIQWGYSVDYATVTYPITFPNAVFCAMCRQSTNNATAGNSSMNQVTRSSALTLYGFGTYVGYWFVIGN